MTEPTKTVRIVAASQVASEFAQVPPYQHPPLGAIPLGDQAGHKTVNIITFTAPPAGSSIPTIRQGPTGIQGGYPTYVAGPTGTGTISPANNLPTIFINGYIGPQ